MNIGIDIGGVILTKAKKGEIPIEIDSACDVIKKLAETYDIFIISKIKTEKMQGNIIKTLKDINFFEKTGVKIENIFFVKSIEEKVQQALKLGIDIFIDDSYKVLKPMYEKGIKTVCLSTKYKKEQKNQGILVRSWDEVLKVIGRL